MSCARVSRIIRLPRAHPPRSRARSPTLRAECGRSARGGYLPLELTPPRDKPSISEEDKDTINTSIKQLVHYSYNFG